MKFLNVGVDLVAGSSIRGSIHMRDASLGRVQSDIVAKIIDYVRRENLPIDSHLTEGQLAEEFGVSRSPIRAALQLLAEKGIVISAANKGHYLACDGRPRGD